MTSLPSAAVGDIEGPGGGDRGGTFAIRRFAEASEQERSLPGFAQHYSQLSPGRFEGSISSLALPDFLILRERINVAVAQAFTAPKDRLVFFCLPSHAGGFHADGKIRPAAVSASGVAGRASGSARRTAT